MTKNDRFKIFNFFWDFGGGHGPSSRFFERASTFLNFWRLDSCRTSLGLQFEPYVGLGVAWAEKLKKSFLKFREYVSRILLQGLQPPTKVSLIFNRFPKTLGPALLSLTVTQIMFTSLAPSSRYEYTRVNNIRG